MKISLCEAIAGVQIAAAVAALALGQPAVAGIFAIFAVVQLISVVGQRCGLAGACETRLVAQEVPARRTGEGR